ncbi:tRNA G18 (ribose-2'-O)-methylase SpoU [Lewinella aquimaris]|uniref:tRNA G18 (Ribose-2'-O)-methylase SpoU n=1 Tax=Neolewinella aquimaris TaxID=1835722 RepID=A0A840EC97_9BACT|nr:tRNA G18 (ribose-2'-O)-methylase SpoU [Neolewinella aquimaris]
MFRLADAAGVSKLLLAGTTPTPPQPGIRKTARSTERSVPYEVVKDPVAYLARSRQSGALILALEITDQSTSLFDLDLPEPDREIVLLAGSESTGIAGELLALCDAAVHLPMYGQNTSMNVTVALGAAVYLILMKVQ